MPFSFKKSKIGENGRRGGGSIYLMPTVYPYNEKGEFKVEHIMKHNEALSKVQTKP